MHKKLHIKGNLAVLRKDKNLTYTKLAKELKMSQGYLYRLENKNEIQDHVGLDTVIKIADYFNISLEELCFNKYSLKVEIIKELNK